MFQLAITLASTYDWMPGNVAGNWPRALFWPHAISNALITMACFSIAFSLAHFIWHRKARRFQCIALTFIALLLACGTNFLLSLVLLWQPLYGLDTGMKVATAMIAIACAGCLLSVMPRVLRLENPKQLPATTFEKHDIEQTLLESLDRLETKRNLLFGLSEAIP